MKITKKTNIMFSGVAGSFGGIHQHGRTKLARELLRFNAANKNMDFGLLYNALIQGDFGKETSIEGCLKDIIVMADSGGFQLMTGVIKGGTEDAKMDVYRNQAKYADYGFCFDEVPVSGEYYDHTKALEKTLQTNNNIKKQIEVFKELNSKCLIFPIAKIQTEDKEIAYEHLLKDCDVSLLAGMGANTNTFGDFFAYPFFFKEFRAKIGFPNVLHHLGVGSPKRFFPFYLLAKEGFFGEDFKYCIDATSYSHSVVLRSEIVLENGKFVSFSDLTDDEYEAWRNYCLTYIPELCEFEAFNKIDRHKTLTTKGGLSCVMVTSSIAYAMKMFSKIEEDPYKFAADNNILTFQQLQSIKELAKCSDWKDYYEWKGVFGSVWAGSVLKPARLQALKTMPRNNLDAFF